MLNECMEYVHINHTCRGVIQNRNIQCACIQENLITKTKLRHIFINIMIFNNKNKYS